MRDLCRLGKLTLRNLTLILTLLVMALLAVNPSVVQAVTHGAENGGSRETVLQRIDEAIPRWSRVISRVQDQLTDPGLSLPELKAAFRQGKVAIYQLTAPSTPAGLRP